MSEYEISSAQFHCNKCNNRLWNIEYFSAVRHTITVNRSSANVSIGLYIQRLEKSIIVTGIESKGLFDGTDLESNMILESINGIRYSSYEEGKTLLKKAQGRVTIVAYK